MTPILELRRLAASRLRSKSVDVVQDDGQVGLADQVEAIRHCNHDGTEALGDRLRLPRKVDHQRPPTDARDLL